MPKILKGLVCAEMALGLVLAALLLFLDDSGWRWVSSAAALLPCLLCWSFWRRMSMSYAALLGYCITAVVLGGGFSVIQLLTINSILTTPSNVAMVIETGITSVLVFVLLAPSTRSWFFSPFTLKPLPRSQGFSGRVNPYSIN